jgi:hypothetical protein
LEREINIKTRALRRLREEQLVAQAAIRRLAESACSALDDMELSVSNSTLIDINTGAEDGCDAGAADSGSYSSSMG